MILIELRSMRFIKKHKPIIIVIAGVVTVLLLDFVLWRVDVSGNRNILKADIISISADKLIVPEITESCRVNVSKTFKTTSCDLWAYLVIKPEGAIEDTLGRYFKNLNQYNWDTNFEEFKVELLAGESRFDNQKIRFYHKDYDPNGDHDFIDVYRVDKNVVLSDTGIQSSQFGDTDTNLVVLRFHRDQRSSLAHYAIGQFVSF